MKPLTQFRVYIPYSSLYFLVYVWDLKKELVNYRLKCNLTSGKDVTAFTYSYDLVQVYKNRSQRKRPIVGEIHFHRKRLGTEIIAHESTHAVCSALRRLNFKFSNLNEDCIRVRKEHEELLAFLTGKFQSNLVRRLYNLKLIS